MLEHLEAFEEQDTKTKFLNNLVFNERPVIQSSDGFQNLDLEDKEQVCEFIKQKKVYKGFAMLQNFINAMEEKNVWNSYALLEIANNLSYDEEANELLFHNCISPLTKTILTKQFDWGIFKKAYAVWKDTVNACKVFNLAGEELQECIKDLEQGKKLDVGLYAIKKLGDVALEHAKRFKNVEDYQEARKMAFFNEFPELVDKYIGRVPNGVLSTILLFKKADEDLTPLEMYNTELGEYRFWEKTMGFKDEIIVNNMTEACAENVLLMHQIIHGENFDHYGNEPLKGIFYEKVFRPLKGRAVPPYPARNEPLSDERSIYVIKADKEQFRFCESSIPYLLTRIENTIATWRTPALRDCKLDYRPVHGHKNITMRGIFIDTREMCDAYDLFEPFSIKAMLGTLDLDTILTLLCEFRAIGEKIKCYDPSLLLAISILLKSGYNANQWCQAYIKDPLMFTFCFNRAIMAYLLGAEDYSILFKLNSPQWFSSYKQIAFMIREYYNLAATCFNFMLAQTSKLADYEGDLQLDYNFPHIAIIQDRFGGSKEIDLYKVLEDPNGYAKSLANSIIGDIVCEKDTANRIIIKPKLGGAS